LPLSAAAPRSFPAFFELGSLEMAQLPIVKNL
jgi:hypothetical protein